MEPPTAALAPNDAMRNGVATVKGELMTVHPVQPIQASMAKDEVQRQRGVLAATYGQHVPLRMQIESEILSQFRRLPTLQSSMLGLETLAGRDTQINVADVFGAPPPPPRHTHARAHNPNPPAPHKTGAPRPAPS